MLYPTVLYGTRHRLFNILAHFQLYVCIYMYLSVPFNQDDIRRQHFPGGGVGEVGYV